MAISDTSGTNSTEPTTPEGSLSQTTTLYKGPEDKNQKFSWLEKEPVDVVDAAETAETAKNAIILRLEKASDSRKKYELHSLIIQSPQLKDVLDKHVLDNYPGICCTLKRLEFEAPFAPFVHRWRKLCMYRGRSDLDETTKEHVGLLHDVLREWLGDVIRTTEDYIDTGVVTFEHVWAIFQPGDVVFVPSHHGAPMAMKLKNGAYGKTQCGTAYGLSAEVIDWNGSHFGRKDESVGIAEYLGTKKITELRAFPLSFHPHEAKIREALLERGKIFESFAGSHYKQYNGFAVDWDKDRNEVLTECSGRIIIDSYTFRHYLPRFVGSITPLDPKECLPEDDDETEAPPINDEYPGLGKHTFDRSSLDTKRLRLTPELQLIAAPRVRGYSLKKKKWLLFYLDGISDITFDADAFDSLVLPEDQKELILTFAESQAMNQDVFDDVISGKGRGHITLLSGPPGVGKTLTAESVAEHMRVPLYMMSAGDLGIKPEKVEKDLTAILDMVAKWRAVLLIDECDVFLSTRTSHSLERNKLVSIFLRTLEYYEGILFLTTNRIANIDPAFQSRIHVSIGYPELTRDSRLTIWNNFLGGLKVEQRWQEGEVEALAEEELNGRQIKNVLKSAVLVAQRRREPLGRKFVELVLGIERRRPGVGGAGEEREVENMS